MINCKTIPLLSCHFVGFCSAATLTEKSDIEMLLPQSLVRVLEIICVESVFDLNNVSKSRLQLIIFMMKFYFEIIAALDVIEFLISVSSRVTVLQKQFF